MVWKKSKGDIIFWRDSNLTVCNPFLLPNKKAIQFFDVQRILQFSSWSTGYYQDYTARLLLSISDFRFCKKGKLYHPKGTFTIGFPRDGTSRCPFVPGQKNFLVPLFLCPGTKTNSLFCCPFYCQFFFDFLLLFTF